MEREIISFDYAIKDILRDKANFDILSGFLTELLEKPITVEQVLESEGNPQTADGKVNRLDLKAKLDDGEFAVFEIQFFDQIDFLGKILFNACKAVVEQISKGELYDVKKVYSINIAYFSMGSIDEYLYVANLSEFKGLHFDEVIPFSQNLNPQGIGVPKEIHPEYFLILPRKYETEEERARKAQKGNITNKVNKVKKVRCHSKFDEWVYVLKNSSVKSDFTAAGIQAAGEKLDILKMTPEQRAAYEANEQAKMTLKSQLYTAELKGEAIGLEKGKAEGEATGEYKKAVAVALKALEKGMSIEDASDLSGLSKEQIEELIKTGTEKISS